MNEVAAISADLAHACRAFGERFLVVVNGIMMPLRGLRISSATHKLLELKRVAS
jgi:hypothetical protein